MSIHHDTYVGLLHIFVVNHGFYKWDSSLSPIHSQNPIALNTSRINTLVVNIQNTSRERCILLSSLEQVNYSPDVTCRLKPPRTQLFFQSLFIVTIVKTSNLSFPRHRGLAVPPCITARASRTCLDACRDRLLAVSFEVGGGENVPGIPRACAIRHFTCLVRGPLAGSIYCRPYCYSDGVYPSNIYRSVCCGSLY